jgi:hypothetical protein
VQVLILTWTYQSEQITIGAVGFPMHRHALVVCNYYFIHSPNILSSLVYTALGSCCQSRGFGNS